MIKQAISNAETALSGLEAEIVHGAAPERVRDAVLNLTAGLRRAVPHSTDALRESIDALERLHAGSFSEAESTAYDRLHEAIEEMHRSRMHSADEHAIGLGHDESAAHA